MIRRALFLLVVVSFFISAPSCVRAGEKSANAAGALKRLSKYTDDLEKCNRRLEKMEQEVDKTLKILVEVVKRNEVLARLIGKRGDALERLLKKKKVDVHQNYRTGRLVTGFSPGPYTVNRGFYVPKGAVKKILDEKKTLKNVDKEIKSGNRRVRRMLKKLRGMEKKIREHYCKCRKIIRQCRKPAEAVRKELKRTGQFIGGTAALMKHRRACKKTANLAPDRIFDDNYNKRIKAAKMSVAVNLTVSVYQHKNVRALENAFVLKDAAGLVAKSSITKHSSVGEFVNGSRGCLFAPAYSAGSSPAPAKPVIVTLRLGIKKLEPGEKTWGRFIVTGTTKKVRITFENKTPNSVQIIGGNKQTATTSGGENNKFRFEIKGLAPPGYYTISYTYEVVE